MFCEHTGAFWVGGMSNWTATCGVTSLTVSGVCQTEPLGDNEVIRKTTRALATTYETASKRIIDERRSR